MENIGVTVTKNFVAKCQEVKKLKKEIQELNYTIADLHKQIAEMAARLCALGDCADVVRH